MHAYTFVVLEEFDEGVDGATVAEVADEGDGSAGDGAQLGADGEKVEEGLGWVLAAAVSTVDNRHRGAVGSNVGAGFFWVTQDDGIAVAAEGSDCVAERLAFLGAGVGCGDGDGAATEALHGDVERGGGAGGRFVEKGAQDAAFEDVENALAMDAKAHFLGDCEEDVEVMAGELGDREDVLLFERGLC